MNFWKEKTVLITGHTGFKGAWLSLYIQEMGAKVFGYALRPKTKSIFNIASLHSEIEGIFGDIRDLKNFESFIKDVKPDILFHLAAQPLVIEGYLNPLHTIETNVLGSSNVLMAASKTESVKAVVNVTSDKCYENIDLVRTLSEGDRLGGSDPYSASKACVEILSNSIYNCFYKKNNIGLATARAGNVIGGGDWGKNRLVPDILNAIDCNHELVVRYPKATRPWQHVMEPLYGYVLLAQNNASNPNIFSEPYNFGPNTTSVVSVERLVQLIYGCYGIKTSFSRQKGDIVHEAQSLNLDSAKAYKKLNWMPTWSLEQTCNSIVDWHKAYKSGENMNLFTKKQISQFLKSIKFDR